MSFLLDSQMKLSVVTMGNYHSLDSITHGPRRSAVVSWNVEVISADVVNELVPRTVQQHAHSRRFIVALDLSTPPPPGPPIA